jgi:hypothetical protein
MTEEPSSTEQTAVEKLLIDDQMNFPFHAAYLVYSDLFDQATSIGVKKELNTNIDALKQGQIDCETYYRNISPYRKMAPMPRQDRFSVQTQRKKDWRQREQRSDRIRRHKK